MLLLCVINNQAKHIMEKVHTGSCGSYMSGRVLVEKNPKIVVPLVYHEV